MPDKDLKIRFILIDYWIDRKNKKAYCILQYIDLPDKDKKSNLYLIESNYDDK